MSQFLTSDELRAIARFIDQIEKFNGDSNTEMCVHGSFEILNGNSVIGKIQIDEKDPNFVFATLMIESEATNDPT